MARKPKIWGPRDRIDRTSSIPLPVALSEVKPAAYDPTEASLKTGIALPNIVGGKLGIPDDFDLKAYLAWRVLVWSAGQIEDPDADTEYSVPVSVIKDYIEPDSKHESTDNVQRAIACIEATKVELRYKHNGENLISLGRLADFTFVADQNWNVGLNGTVRYRFPKSVRWLLASVGTDVLWSRIELSVINRFGSTHEARLYEFLSRYVHRRCHITEELPLDKLYELLAVPADSSYRKDWRNFRVRVVEKVQAVLKEYGTFEMNFAERRSGRGGKVQSVMFSVMAKDSGERVEETKKRVQKVPAPSPERLTIKSLVAGILA